MQIFSFFIVIYILVCIVKNKNVTENIVSLMVLIAINNIEVANFFSIGGVAVLYVDFMAIAVLCILGIRNFSGMKINRKYFMFYVSIIICIVIGIIYCNISPSEIGVMPYSGSWDTYIREYVGNIGLKGLEKPHITNQSFLQLFKTCIYLAVIRLSFSGINDWKTFVKDIAYKNALIFVPIYLVEFVVVKLMNSFAFYQVRSVFFGGAATSRYIGKLSGLTFEPSHFSYVLFISILLNIFVIASCKDLLSKQQESILKIATCTEVVLCLFCGAFSSVIFLILLALFFLYYKASKKVRKKTSIVLVLLLACVIIAIYNLDFLIIKLRNMEGDIFKRMANTLYIIKVQISGDNISLYTSEGTRFTAIFNSIKSWLNRPIFGVGIGTSYTYSGVVSILESVGLLGFILWYNIMFVICPKYKVPIAFIVIYLVALVFTGDFGLFYSIDTCFLATTAGLWKQCTD